MDAPEEHHERSDIQSNYSHAPLISYKMTTSDRPVGDISLCWKSLWQERSTNRWRRQRESSRMGTNNLETYCGSPCWR